MRPYPLPTNISRERFWEIVNGLRQQLLKMGIDPDCNLKVEDINDRHFSVFISQSAAQLLEAHPSCE